MAEAIHSIRDLLRQKNFVRLFVAVLFSELGGYLTNTVILFYVNEVTGGSRFYLGLSQVLFVAPLLLGTLVGGTIGERLNKRRLMIACELFNLALVISMFWVEAVMLVIIIRAAIVFFAGMYNPNRMAIMQELVPGRSIRQMNGAFTAIYALLHSLGPWLGAAAYKTFGGMEEVLVFNIVTYVLGAFFVYLLNYQPQREAASTTSFHPFHLFREVREGLRYVSARGDLSALLQSVSVGGICLGVFFPTLLPFLQQTFQGDEGTYGQLMVGFGLGGILGGLLSSYILRYFAKGRVLVTLSIVQAAILLAWTQVTSLPMSFLVLFIWGAGMMCLVSTYINYVQVNVASNFRTRAFSIYDQSISLNVIIGAVIVTLVGDRLSPYQLLTYTAIGALTVLVLRYSSEGTKALYAMET